MARVSPPSLALFSGAFFRLSSGIVEGTGLLSLILPSAGVPAEECLLGLLSPGSLGARSNTLAVRVRGFINSLTSDCEVRNPFLSCTGHNLSARSPSAGYIAERFKLA